MLSLLWFSNVWISGQIVPWNIRPFSWVSIFILVIDPKAVQFGHFSRRNAPFEDKALNHNKMWKLLARSVASFTKSKRFLFVILFPYLANLAWINCPFYEPFWRTSSSSSQRKKEREMGMTWNLMIVGNLSENFRHFYDK